MYHGSIPPTGHPLYVHIEDDIDIDEPSTLLAMEGF